MVIDRINEPTETADGPAGPAAAPVLPHSSLAEVVERNRHVRAIRQLSSRTRVPEQDRVVRTARPRTVVVVDDESDLVELTVMILEAAGHRVHGAVKGREGLELVRLHTPDILFVDHMMSDMTGAELAAALREEPAFGHTKIVIVSGTPEETVRAASDRFDLFLTKPAHPDHLLLTIEVLCRDGR